MVQYVYNINKGVDSMNMFVNNELVVLRGEESILDYIEDNMGTDVRKAVEKPIKRAKKNVETVEYERDIAWDGIRNLEAACFEGTKSINKAIFYIENAKRINRDTLVRILEEAQREINPKQNIKKY